MGAFDHQSAHVDLPPRGHGQTHTDYTHIQDRSGECPEACQGVLPGNRSTNTAPTLLGGFSQLA
jgi:hypothetical protein